MSSEWVRCTGRLALVGELICPAGARFTGRLVGRSLVSLVLLPVKLGTRESTVQRSDMSFTRSSALKELLELLQSSTNASKEPLLAKRLLPRRGFPLSVFFFCLTSSESFVATLTQCSLLTSKSLLVPCSKARSSDESDECVMMPVVDGVCGS
jgi:hypothetical protein